MKEKKKKIENPLLLCFVTECIDAMLLSDQTEKTVLSCSMLWDCVGPGP